MPPTLPPGPDSAGLGMRVIGGSKEFIVTLHQPRGDQDTKVTMPRAVLPCPLPFPRWGTALFKEDPGPTMGRHGSSRAALQGNRRGAPESQN